jgi:hypothetical protein
MTCPVRQLGTTGVRRAERTPEGLAAPRAARRLVMVMPAGNAAHIEARVAFGFGKLCYAVGPVAKAETRYRFFDRMSQVPQAGRLSCRRCGTALTIRMAIARR